MNNNRGESSEKRVGQFKFFYLKENERSVPGSFFGSEYPIHKYQAIKAIPKNVPFTPDRFYIDLYLDDFDSIFKKYEKCGGDFI